MTEASPDPQVGYTQPLNCPFCGTEAIKSITGKLTRCGNEDCFLGYDGFFLEVEEWNKRA